MDNSASRLQRFIFVRIVVHGQLQFLSNLDSLCHTPCACESRCCAAATKLTRWCSCSLFEIDLACQKQLHHLQQDIGHSIKCKCKVRTWRTCKVQTCHMEGKHVTCTAMHSLDCLTREVVGRTTMCIVTTVSALISPISLRYSA